MDEGRKARRRNPFRGARPPSGPADSDGQHADREGVVHRAAGRGKRVSGLAQPLDPRKSNDREAGEEQVRPARPERCTCREDCDETSPSRRQVKNRVGNGDCRGEGALTRQLISIRGQDRRADREEDRGPVEIDSQFLGSRYAATDGEHQGDADRRDEQQEADIRRRRDTEVADRRLNVPAELPDKPCPCANAYERPQALFKPGGAVGRADRDRGGQEARGRPMGVLPEDDLTANIQERQQHEQPDHRQSDAEQPIDCCSFHGGRPKPFQRPARGRTELLRAPRISRCGSRNRSSAWSRRHVARASGTIHVLDGTVRAAPRTLIDGAMAGRLDDIPAAISQERQPRNLSLHRTGADGPRSPTRRWRRQFPRGRVRHRRSAPGRVARRGESRRVRRTRAA